MHKQKAFRICAKKLFLTYSQVDPELSAEHLLMDLQAKGKVTWLTRKTAAWAACKVASSRAAFLHLFL